VSSEPELYFKQKQGEVCLILKRKVISAEKPLLILLEGLFLLVKGGCGERKLANGRDSMAY
jgi:hypothetical protein